MTLGTLKLSTERIQTYLVAALAFSFPFGRRYTTILIFAILALTLIAMVIDRRQVVEKFKRLPDRVNWLFALPVLFYLVLVVGLTYTEDIKQGLFELEKKSTLIFFPVFFFLFRKDFDTRRTNFILSAFLAGILLAALISLGFGFYRSTSFMDGHLQFRTAVLDKIYIRGDSFFEQVTQGGNYFFGNYISPFIRNIYYGMYLSFGCLLALRFAWLQNRRWLYALAFVVLVTVLLFVDSRGPVMGFAGAVFIAALLSKRLTYPKITALTVLVLVIGYVTLSPRTVLMIKDFKATLENVDYNSTESTALRLVVWRASLEVIRSNWMTGVGTGDANKAMYEQTAPLNKQAAEEGLNSHNEFFQTTIMAGLPALAIVVAMLVIPVLRRRDNLVALFVAIIAFNMLFESIFENFHGIVFFSFFYCLFLAHLTHDADEVTTA